MAQELGGALYLHSSTNAVIQDTVFEKNSAN